MDKNSKIYLVGCNKMIESAIWKDLKADGYVNIVGLSERSLNLMDEQEVKNLFKSEKPEYVILCTSSGDEIHSKDIYRNDIIFHNLQNQSTVINECINNKIKKLLLLGNISNHPKNAENYLIATPSEVYGPYDNFDLITSKVIPTLIRKMHLAKCVIENKWSTLQKDIEIRSINSVSGASTLDELVFVLNKYGIHSHHLELRSTGKLMKDYLWSSDLAKACIFMLSNLDFTSNSHYQIGTCKEVTNKRLAELVANIVGYNGRLRFIPVKEESKINKMKDLSNINNSGWKYTTDLEEGIFLLYQWYLKDQENIHEPEV